jgi:hypothetical protein
MTGRLAERETIQGPTDPARATIPGPRSLLRRAVRTLLLPMLVGGVCGVLSLGLVGRLAMRVLAILAGVPTGFSRGGTLEVLVAGLVFGAVAALPLAVVIRRRTIGVGLAYGALLFLVLFLFPPPAARSAAALVPGKALLVFGLFLPVFVLYGGMLVALMRRMPHARHAGGAPSPPAGLAP